MNTQPILSLTLTLPFSFTLLPPTKTTTLSFSLIRTPFLNFPLSLSFNSPSSTFRTLHQHDDEEDDDVAADEYEDEEEDYDDEDDDDVAAGEYDDVSDGAVSDVSDTFDASRHDGAFKWQRVEKLCNEVREFGADIIDTDELASVYDFRIDKFQRLAIEAFLRGSSVVVSAPTSSGKTLIAEAIAVAAVSRGWRIFYTTPLKALTMI